MHWRKSNRNDESAVPLDVLLQMFQCVCARLATMGSHLEFWHKAGELLMPVVECRRWRDDQEWTPDVISLLQEQKSKYNVNHRNRWSAVLVWAAPRKQEVLEGLWSPQHAPSCQRQLTEKLAFPPFFLFFLAFGVVRLKNVKSWQISSSEEWSHMTNSLKCSSTCKKPETGDPLKDAGANRLPFRCFITSRKQWWSQLNIPQSVLEECGEWNLLAPRPLSHLC